MKSLMECLIHEKISQTYKNISYMIHTYETEMKMQL